MISESIRSDNLASIRFAQDVLLEFKQKNISEGINAQQALWLHHRASSWTCAVGGSSFNVNLLAMAAVGDIEAIYVALAHGVPDDMTLAYHWMSQQRVDWLKSRIAAHMGWS